MTAMMTAEFDIANAYGAQLLEDAETITLARSVNEVFDHLAKRVKPIGFDRLLYGFTRFRTNCGFGSPDDMVVLSSHDTRYTERFVGEAMYFHAPMVQWAKDNVGACSWAQTQSRLDSLTPRERKVLEFNCKMGVIAGYTVSFPHVTSRSRAALALTARPGLSQDNADLIWSQNGRWICALANMAHLKIMSLPHSGPRRPLTKRQREVLEWVGDGKTMQDIATIMGLTAATVEKHLRLARENLDVSTTAQAVMKASLQNQIFLQEAC